MQLVLSPTRRARPYLRGFTLIEVMIVVAIIAILAAVAYPSYRDYVIRGNLADATNGLSSMRAEMERYYQDNRSYGDVPGFTSPCNWAAGRRTFGNGNFVVTCTSLTPAANPQAYQLTATGANSMAGFVFTVDNLNAMTTGSSVSGYTAATPNACWVVKRGQTC